MARPAKRRAPWPPCAVLLLAACAGSPAPAPPPPVAPPSTEARPTPAPDADAGRALEDANPTAGAEIGPPAPREAQLTTDSIRPLAAPPPNVPPLPATELEIGRPDPERTGVLVRLVNYRDMWDAVGALDDHYARAMAKTPDEKRFARALALQVDGALAEASEEFRSLAVDAAEPRMRRRALAARVAILQALDNWGALEVIARAEAQRADAGGIDPAGVLAWALALAGTPKEHFTIPRSGVHARLVPNALGAPAIEVEIRGKRYEFWIDTGSTFTLLSSDVAAELGVQPLGRDTLMLTTAAGRIQAIPAVLSDMRVLDEKKDGRPLEVRDQRIAIIASADLQMAPGASGLRTDALPIAGVLGANFLRHCDLRLDIPEGSATFYPSATAARGAQRTLHWVGYPVVRLVTAGGTPLLFGLDTGADTSYAAAGVLEKLPGTSASRGRERTMRGFGRTERHTNVVLAALKLEFGTRELRFTNLFVDDRRQAGIAELDGILGRDLASRFPIRIDIGAGVLTPLTP